jgi:hypothetical protein
LYYDTHLSGDGKPRFVSSAVSGVGSQASKINGSNNTIMSRSSDTKSGGQREILKTSSGTPVKRACFVCGSFNHMQNFHAKVGNKSGGAYHNASAKHVNAVQSRRPAVFVPVEGANDENTEPGDRLYKGGQ